MHHSDQIPQQTARELVFTTNQALNQVLRDDPSWPQVRFGAQVIVERYIREKTLPLMDKTKFLVPFELTLGQFLCLLR